LLADAINNHGNYDITIFHTFHDEVESYRTHVWQCNGPCRNRPPYFGLVKRSMNRAPGKGDTWWTRHETDCGGTYTKIQEPAPTKKQVEAMSKKERAGRQKNKLDNWVKSRKGSDVEDGTSVNPIDLDNGGKASTGRMNGKRKAKTVDSFMESTAGLKRQRAPIERAGNGEIPLFEQALVDCPICSVGMAESEINEHLDLVHPA
jgi:hypothetical protein